jgi:hypothetical protein
MELARRMGNSAWGEQIETNNYLNGQKTLEMQTFEADNDDVVKGEGYGLSRKALTDLTFLTELGGQVEYVVSASCRHISRARCWNVRENRRREREEGKK